MRLRPQPVGHIKFSALVRKIYTWSSLFPVSQHTIFMEQAKRKRFFEKELLKEVPRLLSAIDRCPLSVSCGSLDREYWAWASKDFANMDLQRGLLVLAYVFSTEFEGNIYYNRTALLEWVHKGLDFWIQRQSPEGGFDHLYVNERSWMAVAFTLADIANVYKLIGHKTDRALRDRWIEAMRR